MFHRPLQGLQILSPAEIQALFANYQAIRVVNRELYAALTCEDFNNIRVGAAFLRLVRISSSLQTYQFALCYMLTRFS